MKRGLVSFKKVLYEANPVIVDGPVREPVNKQAALIVRPAHWLARPLPSDPDLSDRKVVLQFLSERASMNESIRLLKSQSKDLREKVQKKEQEIADLKSALIDAKSKGESMIKVSVDNADSSTPDFTKYTKVELKAMVDDLIAHRALLASSKNWSPKLELFLRDVTERVQNELARRNQQ